MNKKLLAYAMTGVFCLALLAPMTASAQTLGSNDILDPNFSDDTGLGQADLTTTIAQLIRVALGFLGVIAVVIVLYGGVMWMTAGGNEDRVTKARKIMTAGLIGLIIILAAYAIASFVISNLLSATQQTQVS